MSREPKPWAVLDDEADAAVADAAAPAEPGASPPAPPARGAPFVDLANRTLAAIDPIRAKLKLDARWAAVPIALGAIWLCAAALTADAGAGPARWHVTVVTLLAGLAIVLLLIGRTEATHAGGGASEAVRQALARRLGLADTGDAHGLWASVEAHTANIERRVAEMVNDQRRLQLEVSLAAAQRRNTEAILRAIAEPILVVDRFDHVLFVNDAATELLGRELDLSARPVLEQYVSDEKLVRAIRESRESGGRAAKRRIELELAGRAYALSLSPLPEAGAAAQPDEPAAAGASPCGVVVLLRDVTRDREAAKAKSEFVAHVSHELRTPLSSIRAYTEMLVDGEARDEKTRAEYYGIIQTSADRLSRLIDNMLNISRIEAGTVRIHREPVAVSIIVKEACDSMKPQADEKQITLAADLAPVVDRVSADRDLLYQAVLNLLSNAIKYTPESGQVTVRMISQDELNSIRIEVTDTGVGIPPQDQPHMFEKFYRVEANKHMAKGTGLGLNLVKNIVEVVHEGKLSLKSEVGKGSTFAITLPKVT